MVTNVPYIKVPNVVSDDFYFKKIERNSTLTFIHVSSLNELKNPEGILLAYAKLLNSTSNVLLKMVGNNNEPIKLFAKELNIPEDKIIFTGEISNEQVAAEMQSAQAFILFSHSENFPCTIIESFCCGVPVIATDVGGVAEQINDTNGILIPANDESALLEAMKKMIENYAHYDREKISERAKALYNYDVVGKQIVEIYRSVMER
jgi:glycosyltransferase involved in cell wall biosynthesis